MSKPPLSPPPPAPSCPKRRPPLFQTHSLIVGFLAGVVVGAAYIGMG